jgi:site-specific recombinase XerD
MNDQTPSTTTIKVIVRHSKACRKKFPELTQESKNCCCRKSLYIYENGKDSIISARTRSWEEAENRAQAEKDKRDPLKQKVKELEARLAEKEAATAAEAAALTAKKLSIKDATDRWLNAQKPKKESTRKAHKLAMSRIRDWAADAEIATIDAVSAVDLDKWRGEWKLDAKKPYNQIGLTTQNHFQVYLKSLFRYLEGLELIVKNPAAQLKSIKPNHEEAKPLMIPQFNELLAVIKPFCAAQNGILHDLEAELEALFELQRWVGLRISDALTLPRCALVGNRLTLITMKCGIPIKERVIPDHVAAKLAALSTNRPRFQKEYFFWAKGISNYDSLSATWDRYFQKINAFLHFTDERGEPMHFHSHMLRDTFAVQLLLSGVSLEEVSELLTHTSIITTQKYYAPWVKARRDRLERNSVEAMRSMGAVVTIDSIPAQTVVLAA